MLSGLFIGILFGFILQRGQFCFVSGFRRFHTQRNIRFITALFIAISIQSLGFFSLEALGFITLPTSQLPILATVLGGFLFGVGMMLANCCGSGSWFRTGEGAVGSLLALFSFALTMAATQTGALKHLFNPLLNDVANADNIHRTFAISPWVLVGILLFLTFALLVYERKHPRFSPPPPPTQAVIFPQLFAKPWHPFFTATLLGLLSIVAWLLSAQTGRNFSLGISVPSANVVQYFVIGQQRYLNWGTYLVLGIPLGAFVAAKLSSEFKWRMPEPNTVWQRIVGGIVMGLGAALAGGCTITNSLVATAYFSWQGWLATLMILLGSGVAVRFLKPTECRL